MTQVRTAKVSVSWVAAFVGILIVLHTPPLLAQAPSFRPAVNYGSGGYSPTSVALGDLNGDRILDAVVANQCVDGYTCPNGDYVCVSSDYCSHGAVGVLLGNGDGTFRPAVTYETNGYLPFSIALGDLNGDGKLDLVVVNLCGAVPIDSDYNCPYATVDVMFGNGDGTFGPPFSDTLNGWKPVSVALGDLNGDGKPEIVVADICNMPNTCSFEGCTCTGAVEVLGRIYDSGAWFGRSVALGDVNRDGNLDVLVGNDGGVGVLLGNGDGTLKPAVTHGSGASITVGDVNSDGKPDLLTAVLTSVGVDSVLLGNGDGTFKPAVTYPTGGQYPRSLAVADVNGDGRPDLIVAQRAVGVLIGNGDGTFRPPITFDSGGVGGGLGNSSIAVGDLNKDGKPDLVVVNGNVGVLLNNTAISKSDTSTSLISSLNPTIYGQKVTWTAMVTSSGSITPTGKVHFTWNGYTIGSATLNSGGVAAFTRSNLNADPYPLKAVYVGDANNLRSASPVLNQVIIQATSSAMLTSSPNPSASGQAVTFTSRITSPTVIPKGPVTFTAGKTVLGTPQLSGGTARLTTSSLKAGTTVVTVTYEGDSNIAKSTASETHTVHQ
jgi:hypothetical protein